MEYIEKIQALLEKLYFITGVAYQFTLKTEYSEEGLSVEYDIFWYPDNDRSVRPRIEYYKDIDHAIERLEFLLKTA